MQFLTRRLTDDKYNNVLLGIIFLHQLCAIFLLFRPTETFRRRRHYCTVW